MHQINANAAWAYTGAAIRVAQSMNLMRDNELPNTPDRDMRRRVWWVLYDLERCCTIRKLLILVSWFRISGCSPTLWTLWSMFHYHLKLYLSDRRS